MISHRQRLEVCLAGERPDRVPVALWRHFPVDDQTPQGLAAATLHFQRSFDFDLVKVTPQSAFCLKDWGVREAWRGATEGTCEYVQRVIHRPEDWEQLQPLDPNRGFLGAQIECLRLLKQELGTDTPLLQTIFSPLAQAKNLAGATEMLVHLRRYPEAVHAGLRVITESTLRFIEAARATGISGVFYAVQHAQYGLLSESEFETFGRAYDFQALEPARSLWLNMVHLHGSQVMFEQVADYPVQVLNWHDRDTSPSLAEGQRRFPGVVCGGLQRETCLVLGTPEQVRSQAREAIDATGGVRFLLGTGCVAPITAPYGNLMAARQAVETVFHG